MTTTLKNDIAKILLLTGVVLLIPLIAMQFTSEVNWDWFDFAVMGTMLFTTSLIGTLLTRRITHTSRKLVVGLLLMITFILLWAELAVGLFGTPIAGS